MNIAALREHLRDMSRVTIDADVAIEPTVRASRWRGVTRGSPTPCAASASTASWPMAITTGCIT